MGGQPWFWQVDFKLLSYISAIRHFQSIFWDIIDQSWWPEQAYDVRRKPKTLKKKQFH